MQACCPPDTVDTCGLDLAPLTVDHKCIPVDPHGYTDTTCYRLNVDDLCPTSPNLEGRSRSNGICGFQFSEGCVQPASSSQGHASTE